MSTLSQTFSTDFQTRMIAVAATQPYFLGLYADIFKPGMFTSAYHRDFCSWISEFYAKYNVPPSKSSLRKIMREKIPKDAPLYKGYKILLDNVYSVEVDDAEYVKDQIVVAAKFQSRKAAMIRMAEQLDQGDFDGMDSTYATAKRAGTGAGDIGNALTKSVVEAILKFGFLEQPVRTSYKEFDRASGGMYDSELSVICAPPNRGKTLVLGNVAYGASLNDNVVIYYTLEISAFRMLNRYYAKMTRLPTKDLIENIDKVRGAVKRYRLRTGGEVYIKYYPANSITVETIKSHLSMVHGNDIKPKLVVVDYADKIKPNNPKDPHPNRVQQIYTDLRTLGGEFNCHVLTASQSRRSTLYARIIDLDDMAESWGKAQEADTIAAVCQTREEKLSGVARLFFAKTRNETSGRFVYLKWKPEFLTIQETTRDKYAKIMTDKGFKPPIDEPKGGLDRIKKGNKKDLEMEERYGEEDLEEANYVDKKIGKRKKRRKK